MNICAERASRFVPGPVTDQTFEQKAAVFDDNLGHPDISTMISYQGPGMLLCLPEPND